MFICTRFWCTYFREREKSIKIRLLCPKQNTEHEVLITHPEYIKVLPELLNGEISCYEALHRVEPFLLEKHKNSISRDSLFFFDRPNSLNKDRLYYCINQLEAKSIKDELVALCQLFPHSQDNKHKVIPSKQKVVSNKIIDAIKTHFSKLLPMKIVIR